MSDKLEVLVGRVGRAHGIRGDLTIDVRTDEPDRRFAPGTVFCTRRGPLTVESLHWHSSRLLVRFAEVSDRTTAERLRGTELHIEVDSMERPADPDEFYDHQLVGLRVDTQHDHEIEVVGDVIEVLHLPGQDMLVVRRRDGADRAYGGDGGDGGDIGGNDASRDDVLIPFVSTFVPTIDVAAGRIIVADPVGLLTDDADQVDDNALVKGGTEGEST